ncbi:restriction endonuclease subunit S [Acinetobacter sp. WCHAc060025]|uniref:restriction endonuclease subunit S n=1 Tax=Acinetobacter sp. WCHAc060025 TaxID=2518625 RepID=UPI001023EE8B|nr:restriction endonuclease subunit S [Acinetobacter sp. WCHAc060025]RZG77507.1 restriction endonuclease subunit S [Acinetobacter sp. WCHAc060025]
MAKYEKYAEYKDSGVEWLGEIPSHWEMWKLSHAYNEIGSGTTPSTSNEENFEGDIPWVTTGELRENVILDTKKKVSQRTIELFPTLRKYPSGSIAIAMYGATIGRLGIFGVEATTNQACCVMTSSKVLNNKYLFYWLQAFKNEIIQLSSGGGQPNINQEKVASLKISAPIIKDQIKIANFLDHETAKIDSLIAKQEKLIELLKEKRQAVISHAVTKGLNPDVTMKDSGVEWLGQVPEHWKCIKIKHITTTFEQGWSPQCDSRPAESHEYGVLKVGCVNGGSFRSFENKALPPELEPRLQYLIQKDDLLISRANTKELVGSASVVDGDYPNLILCDKLYRLRFSKNVLPEMVSLYLSIGTIREQIELGATGASHSMQNIGQDTIKELYYLLPPYDEALNILESIKQSNQKIDELTRKAESAIQLMQERRTALISSAVTGKINVTNWQNPNYNNNEANTELGA